VNICWDADVCNVALLWRGAFMDAGKHWTGRGVGDQPPMGFDVTAPAKGYPLQILSNPARTWKPFSLETIHYEKDVADPQKEITIKVPNPDYRFRGYRLDAKRFPTFSYDFRKLAVNDRFDPAGAEGVEALVRTVSMKGEAEKERCSVWPSSLVLPKVKDGMPRDLLRSGSKGQRANSAQPKGQRVAGPGGWPARIQGSLSLAYGDCAQSLRLKLKL